MDSIDQNIENSKTLSSKELKSIKSGSNKYNSKYLNKLPKSTNPLDLVSKVTVVLFKLVSTFLNLVTVKNKKIEQRIDDINIYITKITQDSQIKIARSRVNIILKDINDAEAKINNTRKILNTITILVSVVSGILVVLRNNPTPEPGVVSSKKLVLENLFLSFTVLLSTTTVLLDKLVSELEYQKSRILPIMDVLDQNPEQIDINRLSQLDPTYIEYQGFKFVIKEEVNGPTAKGIKRKYAAALDSNGVEVLKSKYSFTSDAEQLVDELKLIIDKDNLKA